MFTKAYTFDDVALVPQYNNVASRTEPDLSTWITKDIKIGMPILAANMDSVICDSLADILLANGGFPIFHRFTSEEKQMEWAIKYGNTSALSVGVFDVDLPYAKNTKMLALERIIVEGKIKTLCIDIAHGHSKMMYNQIDWLKRTWPELQIIAGNVCTAMGYQDLVNAGADAVKVGIGPGAACTTRMVTGFGVPQFTAISECAKVAEKLRVPLIADGGIRNSRDIVLALAAGASTVMIGKLFALTEESAAEKVNVYEEATKEFLSNYFNNQPHPDLARKHAADQQNRIMPVRKARYRGQASAEFQTDFYGGLKVGTVPEGESYLGCVSGTAQETIDNLLGGLRSGLTYAGARSIKELQRKAEFVEVTNTYMAESKPRK